MSLLINHFNGFDCFLIDMVEFLKSISCRSTGIAHLHRCTVQIFHLCARIFNHRAHHHNILCGSLCFGCLTGCTRSNLIHRGLYAVYISGCRRGILFQLTGCLMNICTLFTDLLNHRTQSLLHMQNSMCNRPCFAFVLIQCDQFRVFCQVKSCNTVHG